MNGTINVQLEGKHCDVNLYANDKVSVKKMLYYLSRDLVSKEAISDDDLFLSVQAGIANAQEIRFIKAYAWNELLQEIIVEREKKERATAIRLFGRRTRQKLLNIVLFPCHLTAVIKLILLDLCDKHK